MLEKVLGLDSFFIYRYTFLKYRTAFKMCEKSPIIIGVIAFFHFFVEGGGRGEAKCLLQAISFEQLHTDFLTISLEKLHGILFRV